MEVIGHVGIVRNKTLKKQNRVSEQGLGCHVKELRMPVQLGSDMVKNEGRPSRIVRMDSLKMTI